MYLGDNGLAMKETFLANNNLPLTYTKADLDHFPWYYVDSDGYMVREYSILNPY